MHSETVGQSATRLLKGTLNVDLTLTLTLGVNASLKFLGTQDSIGGHALILSDGTNTQSLTVPATASTSFEIDFWSPDGSTIIILDAGQGPQGATRSTGPSITWHTGSGVPSSGLGVKQQSTIICNVMNNTIAV